jgi:transketolase
MNYGTEDRPFGHKLADLGEKIPNLFVVDADLQKATETYYFKEAFPDRYFDVGIAEANMIGVSAGLALTGKTVFCGTFATFISQRVCDQVVVSVAYCKTNVKLIGVEAGLSSGRNGASHQSVLDLAIMRSIPNMKVIEPADAIELKSAMEVIAEINGPVYMRGLRGNVPKIFDAAQYQFKLGKAFEVLPGSDLTIMACGLEVAQAIEAADELRTRGVSARVLNMSSIKPIDSEAIIRAAKETGCIVVAENHSIYGGLGGAVSEIVSESCPVPVLRVGLRDTFGEVGPVDWLLDKFQISHPHIVNAAENVLKCKETMK